MKPIVDNMNKDHPFLDNENHKAMASYADYISKLDSKEQIPEVSLLPHYKGLLKFAEIQIGSISGKVLELGSGMGCFTFFLSRYKNIEEIVAYEYSKPLLVIAFPAIFENLRIKYSDINKSIVSRIHGDYNDIKLENNSVDLVFANHSLHHSYDVKQTISEAFRVIKPGGYMVVLERSLPNHTSDDELLSMGKQELGMKHKIRYGVPLERKLTRMDMGEHDWRDGQWQEFFVSSGFILINIIKTKKFKNRYIHALCKRLSNYIYNNYLLKRFLINQIEITFYRYFAESEKEITEFILKKPL